VVVAGAAGYGVGQSSGTDGGDGGQRAGIGGPPDGGNGQGTQVGPGGQSGPGGQFGPDSGQGDDDSWQRGGPDDDDRDSGSWQSDDQGFGGATPGMPGGGGPNTQSGGS